MIAWTVGRMCACDDGLDCILPVCPVCMIRYPVGISLFARVEILDICMYGLAMFMAWNSLIVLLTSSLSPSSHRQKPVLASEPLARAPKCHLQSSTPAANASSPSSVGGR